MKLIFLIIAGFVGIIVLINVLPPFGLPMSISHRGSSYDLVDSKKKKAYLWEYQIIDTPDSLRLELAEVYCERQHFWKRNQIIYLPYFEEDSLKTQIRINTRQGGQWDRYTLEGFESINPLGVVTRYNIEYPADTLSFRLYTDNSKVFVGEVVLARIM